MKFKFKCPHCGQAMECRDEWIGKQVHCPACNQLVKIANNSSKPSLSSAKPSAAPVPATPVGTAVQQSQPAPLQAVPVGIAVQQPQPAPSKVPQAPGSPPQNTLLLPPVNTHLLEAILITFFCLNPLGIIAIVQAVRAQRFYNAKQHEQAYLTAKKAGVWVWVSFVIWLLIGIVGVATEK